MKLFLYSCLAGILALGAACSADHSTEPSPAPTSQESPLWLTFSLGNAGGAGNYASTQRENAPRLTRDGESAAPTDDSKIYSICAYLVDANGKMVAAGSTSDQDDIITESGTTNVTVRLFDARRIERNANYSLRVVANMPETNYTAIMRAAYAGGSDTNLTYIYNLKRYDKKSLETMTSATLPEEGMPMSTVAGDEVTIQIPEGKDYPTKEDAYKVADDAVAKTTNNATIKLTRLLGRLDFKLTAQDTANGIPADNEFSILDDKYRLSVAALTPVNLATTQYLLPQAVKDGTQVKCPLNQLKAQLGDTFPPASGLRRLASDFSAADYTPLEYVAEYVPDNSGLSIRGTTAVIVTALLKVTEHTPTDVTVKMGTKESLWYFDDGVFQGAPLADKPASTVTGHWHEIKYDDSLGGYPLYYIKAISTGLNTEAKTDDGKIDLDEYGIVRNYIYQISVKSFNLLPRPTIAIEPTEESMTMSLKSTPWAYHRVVIDI